MTDGTDQFWTRVPLSAMTTAQWESLCDGCGKCCLEKLEDEDTGEIAFTSVPCVLLDRQSCRCMNYVERNLLVPDCVPLSPDNISELAWMPSTCAYRLLAEGKPLPRWHPLLTGDPASVHRARQSVRGRTVSPDRVVELEDHIVSWPE